ncbi:PadR family transcriptional regulator [Caldisericum sp. AR60]|uniref:PadR family transcriptional regulator n=1 Tax=Caldisericum sp. AR60 TaxID=3397852 RepID=UPI0039FCB5FE
MKKYSKIGFKIESILSAALLLSLMKSPSYGYSIPDNLKDFGINPKDVQHPVVYRLLKDMELKGLVKSKWEFEKSGPSKRVYFITNKDKIYLKEWKSYAKIKFEAISKILNQIVEESNG